MKSTAEAIYAKCPIWLQNALLSVYGYNISRIRFGRKYNDFQAQYRKQLRMNVIAMIEHQTKEMLNLLQESVIHVPYYRQLFSDNGLMISDINSIDDFRMVPLLDKETVRKNPLSFVNDKYKLDRLLTIHTTGTTGTPLRIYCNSEVRQRNYAFYNRFLELNRFNVNGKRATFGGRIIVPSRQNEPPFWRYSCYQRNLLFSSYHLTEGNIPLYIAKLVKYQPDYIDSYPSSLYAIALHAKRHNINLANITKKITTSAETLFPEQREVIESVFGVPIYDQYGAAEMCVFIAQCKEKKYHVYSDYGIIEFLKEDGHEAGPGEEGELVCTGFINPVMPLIRYRIGDSAVLSTERCKCGSAFPAVERILGRMDDVIVTADDKRIGRLSPVFKGFPVREVQYIQNAIGSVEVLIVKDKGYSSKTEKHALFELRKRLGHEISIELKYVQAIPRGSGGKLRSIISHIGRT